MANRMEGCVWVGGVEGELLLCVVQYRVPNDSRMNRLWLGGCWVLDSFELRLWLCTSPVLQSFAATMSSPLCKVVL